MVHNVYLCMNLLKTTILFQPYGVHDQLLPLFCITWKNDEIVLDHFLNIMIITIINERSYTLCLQISKLTIPYFQIGQDSKYVWELLMGWYNFMKICNHVLYIKISKHLTFSSTKLSMLKLQILGWHDYIILIKVNYSHKLLEPSKFSKLEL